MPHDPIVSRCTDATQKKLVERHKRDLPNILDFVDHSGRDPNAVAWWQCTKMRRADLADAFIWREFYDVYEFSNELVMRLVGTNYYLVNPTLADIFQLYDYWGGVKPEPPECTVESDHLAK